ncbi:MAG: asparagine synthase (glutamine-hydrolyzing) [Acidobacteriota bacterium]
MCGIAGICNINRKEPFSQETIKKMTDTIIHRGPDDEGFYSGYGVALGTRRLKIIDLVTGHQPLSNENKKIWVSFNGEIYNFLELRDELIKKGHVFSTKSDTETIVHSYEEYGEEFLEKLRGMFAISLWDSEKRKLILARDRVGKKPLYYTLLNNGTLLFGSEIKTILTSEEVKKDLDLNALDLFLTLEYIPSPLSIFKYIKKLEPGHMLTFSKEGLKIKKYWKLNSLPENEFENLEDVKTKLVEILKESVRLRLISDVPLGAFLSGGIDSSSVVAMMYQLGAYPIKTFSIGFKESSYSEIEYARKISSLFHTDHEEFILEPKAVELIEKLINFLDEPLGDFSIFPTYLVSKMARKYVTVILSGDGGDELFGGYEHYVAQKIESITRKIPFKPFHKLFPFLSGFLPPTELKKGLTNKFKRFSEGMNSDDELRHFRWMIFLDSKLKENLYTERFKKELVKISKIYETFPFSNVYKEMNNWDSVNGELFLDFKTYLPDDIMVKVDRMSMAESLEARAPLLDHKLVEFVFSLKGNLKVKGLETKWIFKKAMEKYLPKEIIYRQKEGFSIPIKNWLKNELRDLMEEYLSERRITQEGFFNYNEIKRMKDEHINGIENHSHRLWALLFYQYWKEKYLIL